MKTKYTAHIKLSQKRGIPTYLTYDQFWKLKFANCFYCDIELRYIEDYCKRLGVETPWMTLDRKDNNLPYTFENTVSACYLCNKTKGNFFTAEEMREIGQKFIKPKWMEFYSEVDRDFSGWIF